jgi:hypothetical protein
MGADKESGGKVRASLAVSEESLSGVTLNHHFHRNEDPDWLRKAIGLGYAQEAFHYGLGHFPALCEK